MKGNLKHFNAKYIGAGIWKSVLVCIASSLRANRSQELIDILH